MSAKKAPARRKTRRARKVDPETRRHFDLMDQLSFRGKGKGKGPTSWWALPAKGEYGGGCDTGTAAAWAFMKYLRESGKLDTVGHLQVIALTMLGGKRGNVSLRGQAVGFFSTLEHYLRRAAMMDGALDYVSFNTCRDRIEKGLAHTAADEEARGKEYRAEAMRQAKEPRRVHA